MFLAKIIVTLRKSILDPQGKAVHSALESLGMKNVTEVRMGKYIEMKIDGTGREEAELLATETCRKLLANPVMEDYTLSVEEL